MSENEVSPRYMGLIITGLEQILYKVSSIKPEVDNTGHIFISGPLTSATKYSVSIFNDMMTMITVEYNNGTKDVTAAGEDRLKREFPQLYKVVKSLKDKIDNNNL